MRTLSNLRETAERAKKSSIINDNKFKDFTEKNLSDEILNFPIIGENHEDVLNGNRKPDDMLVSVIKKYINHANITFSDLYERVGVDDIFETKQEAYQNYYRLKNKSSITIPIAEKWAEFLGCKLVIDIIPNE